MYYKDKRLYTRVVVRIYLIIIKYAPTEEAEHDEKDKFYEMLEEGLEKLLSYDIKILIGDANTKIGREHWSLISERGNLHQESNSNGIRLHSLAEVGNLKVLSMFFLRKKYRKITWTAPDRIISNQINHVLTDERHH